MSKFRKKPVVIDAVQIDTKDRASVAALLAAMGITLGSFEMPVVAGKACWWRQSYPNGMEKSPVYSLIIPTLEGEMEARDGDWIIRGVAGEFYPCKPDIFAATYDAVE